MIMTYEEEVKELRKKLGNLNEEIVKKLAERVKISKEIGKAKKKYGRSIVDKNQEARVYNQIYKLADKYGLNKEDIKCVFSEIIALCTKVQLSKHTKCKPL